MGSMCLVKAVVWQRQAATPGEELLVLHSSVPDRALSPPFSISLQVVFRKDMAWQRGGGEAGFLRAAAAMILLAIIDIPNLVLAHPAKQQRPKSL